MTERPMMGERQKILQDVKELADLIPKPDNHYHYKITGKFNHPYLIPSRASAQGWS